MKSGDKLRVGVVGTGAIAKVAHFPVLSSLPEVKLAAVYSAHYENAVSAAQRYGAEKACRSFEEFLNAELDCAFLLTPKTIRREYLIPMLEEGMDIFCEKPLSSSLPECAGIAEAVVKRGSIVMVGFNRRFAPCNKRMIEAFGGRRPQVVNAVKCREFKEFRGTLENAIHMVDLMRYMLGECREVSAHAAFTDPFYENLCTAQLVFEEGGVGLLTASRESGQWREHVEAYGGGISALSEDLDSCRIIYAEHEEALHMTPLRKGWCDTVERIGFQGCIEHFIHCVRTRETPLTSVEDAYKTHELMDRILRSAGLPDLQTDYPYRDPIH